MSFHSVLVLIRSTGPVHNSLSLLTLGQSCFYLIEHHGTYTLIDCGLSAHVQMLPKRLSELGIATKQIRRLLLTNVSAARAGGIATFCSYFPESLLTLGVKARRSFEDATFVESLDKEDRGLSLLYPCFDQTRMSASLTLSRDGLASCLKRSEGIPESGVINLEAGTELQIFPYCGFREQSLGYLLPNSEAVIVDQSAGYYNNRLPVAPAAECGFDLALESIRRISELKYNYLALPYAGVLSGKLTRRYLSEAAEAMNSIREEVASALADGLSMTEIQSQLQQFFYTMQNNNDPVFQKIVQQSFEKVVSQLNPTHERV